MSLFPSKFFKPRMVDDTIHNTYETPSKAIFGLGVTIKDPWFIVNSNRLGSAPVGSDHMQKRSVPASAI